MIVLGRVIKLVCLLLYVFSIAMLIAVVGDILHEGWSYTEAFLIFAWGLIFLISGVIFAVGVDYFE